MSLANATTIITNSLTIVSEVITWSGPWVNPLDANATFITWLIDLGIVVPMGFGIFKKVLGLVAGG